MRKATIYALLCFLFIVSSRGQEVEANVMKNCPIQFNLGGQCGNSGGDACVEEYNRKKKKKKIFCSCGGVRVGQCCCIV
uniref:SCR3 protein n=1 Tax=Brassica oleracea TaxID=3712 RepID=Q9FNT3_BRAOL|nr:SCR3 protein [Brassica oleracea]